MVCACFLGGGDGGKHEAMIIKNINWLQKKKLCFSTFSTLHPPLCCGSTYQHGGRGVYELRPHRERNQTFFKCRETG